MFFSNTSDGLATAKIVLSGSGFAGEDTLIRWSGSQGGGFSIAGGTNVNMTRVIWVITTSNVSLQVKVRSTSLDAIEANTAAMDLVRIQ
jgi:hypothetical protein